MEPLFEHAGNSQEPRLVTLQLGLDARWVWLVLMGHSWQNEKDMSVLSLVFVGFFNNLRGTQPQNSPYI